MTADFPWLGPLQPRPKNLWSDVERHIWDTYAAEHSLSRYPDGTEVEPSPEVRANVLDIVSRLPQLPAEDDEGEVDCLGCFDTGFYESDWSYIAQPCMECGRGDWTWGHELLDDIRRDR